MEGDPCKFALTSRLTNGGVESFVLHSSHAGVREVWTLQISQILESQQNFLNGRLSHTPTHKWDMKCIKSYLLCLPLSLVLPHHSSDLTNRLSEETRGGKWWIEWTQHDRSRWKWVKCTLFNRWKWKLPRKLHPFRKPGWLSSTLQDTPALPSPPTSTPPPWGRPRRPQQDIR